VKFSAGAGSTRAVETELRHETPAEIERVRFSPYDRLASRISVHEPGENVRRGLLAVIVVAAILRRRKEGIAGTTPPADGVVGGTKPVARRGRRLRADLGVSFWAGLAIAGIALMLGYGTTYIAADEPHVRPSVAMLTFPEPDAPVMRLSAKAQVTVHPGLFGCSPVHVAMEFRPGYSYFEKDSYWSRFRKGAAAPPITFGIGINGLDEPKHVRVRLDRENDFSTFDRSGHTIMAPYGAKAARAVSVNLPVIAYGEEIAYGITGTIRDWPIHQMPVLLEFDANWSSRRAMGSCYVRLPALVGEPAFGAAVSADFALEYRHLVPHQLGVTAPALEGESLIEVTNGTDTTDPRSPPAETPEGGDWKCRVDPNSIGNGISVPPVGRCDGLTIATRQNADNVRVFLTFVAAALFSLALQMLYEHVRARRSPVDVTRST
jgi:hypothetical protein